MISQEGTISLLNVIAPSFYDAHWDIFEDKYSHYWFKGGRGSTKSSFVAVEIILGMMNDPKANAVALRRIKDTLKDSVYEQLCWAIEVLGVDRYWDKKISPMSLTYLPAGQKILFRGADNPKKIKSTKFRKGYCKYIWFEEVDEFEGIEPIRTINQSLMRGGNDSICFYSFNPPKNPSNWTNMECKEERKDRLVHHSTYLTVPVEWLGNQFIKEAEHLRDTKKIAYDHEYLGEEVGSGGEYFDEFRHSIHVIEPFIIPDHWRRYRVFDYGLDMLACYWVAVNTQGKLFVYKELYESGHIVSKASTRITEVNGKDNIYETFGPPDMRNRQKDTGKSLQELFVENGIWLTIADNERITGWMNLKEWLDPYETLDEVTGETIITADLVFFKNCTNIIRCLPQIQRDEKEPNDVAETPHELTHAPDAIRYLTAGRPRPPRVIAPSTYNREKHLDLKQSNGDTGGLALW